MVKLSLNDAYTIAKSRGGVCLSTIYNYKTPMHWKCIKGHEWFATFASIKNGKTWCPICSDTKLDISIAKEMARSKNGECLSKKYINNRSPLLWRCNKGHEWYTNLNSIKRNRWCPDCAHRRPLTLEIAKQIAYTRNGNCISEKYINNNLPLLWHCSKGHEWNASLYSIKNKGTWCPYCAFNRPCTLEDAKQVAYNRNGVCLSENFINTRLSLLWMCDKKHKWFASFDNIKNGNKTPEHPTGLELDIPYYHYGFAVEVQGIQHEKYIKFFHRGDPNNFSKQQERDQLKKELCEENWIVLRYVWYYEDPYIIIPEHLRELGLIE
ncbi:hypothetical protein Glove_158g5 [Diversispora epigaea]|uniref:Treble clef zinc finger domain-containing protein n=1 Tax=Diversispora epigaea TaxID=1348612 RepID=A0A397IRU4_9GLOM|nr:hypothetical protein Glove_158g5 [Diversispora epigaea]